MFSFANMFSTTQLNMKQLLILLKMGDKLFSRLPSEERWCQSTIMRLRQHPLNNAQLCY